jgi:hypothetical protein
MIGFGMGASFVLLAARVDQARRGRLRRLTTLRTVFAQPKPDGYNFTA